MKKPNIKKLSIRQRLSRRFIQSRRFYYSLAALVVIAVNVNAWYAPVVAQTQYIWSRQQSVVEEYGRWDILEYESPVRAIHAALLKNGKVLLIAGSGNDEKQFDARSFRTVVWDPATGKFNEVKTPWDAFCAGHVFLPDGKLLVAGGTRLYENLNVQPILNYAGLKDAYIFDPDTEKYEKVDSMEFARWYPTLVTLGDGKIVTVAGLDERGRMSQGDTEIFDPETKQWTTRPDLDHDFPTYPSLTLMADGRLFYSGIHQGYVPGPDSLKPGLWNLTNNNFQRVSGMKDPLLTVTGSTVMLPPAQDQKVMVLGGALDGEVPQEEATNRTAVIDLDESDNPTFKDGPNLKYAGRYQSAVILPDDTVLQTGGSKGYRALNFLTAQIYHPKTNSFTDAATPRVGRNYHSEAILLPDGRVATFGSDPINGKFEMRIEVYSPAYLFKKTPRPAITGGNTDLTRGVLSGFAVNRPQDIKSAKLMRPSAVTHVTDVEQRSIDLPFKRTATGIDFTVPENPNLVPPGWYMAFVTDKHDVPSVAYWVHVK